MQKNKGMLLENIINRSIEFMWINHIAYIEKKHLPIKFSKIVLQNHKLNFENAIVLSKSTVDYIGCYNGSFIAFEAKTCDSELFSLSNLKEHQFEYLENISNNGGEAFVIFFFSAKKEFYKLDIKKIMAIWQKQKSISYWWIKENSKALTLEFPGLLNICN
ncbi:Holliday junction resolvase RecU [Mycoplasmopsis sturni]|uniref:Holliday junction resolvase RecU n=1 Tax=Mycoplasmopsis sturni TaxID=39047 RepID=UPI000562CABB|nr:Holliday junction resolvase RecU [Mycoplasmopsis sturni]